MKLRDLLRGRRHAAERAESRPTQAAVDPSPPAATELEQARARLTDLETGYRQLLSILAREHGLVPPPPKHLQVRVVGGYMPGFMESGYTSVFPDFNRALAVAGKRLEDFRDILDFGCGCGRAIRALARLLPGSRLHGTDIDPEAIAWLQTHCGSLAKFFVVPHVPPAPCEDDAFDLVYSISVFTHLPEDMQFQWLEELRRVTRPGGYLILTTHGKRFIEHLSDAYATLEKNGFFYSDFNFNYGKSVSLPDFYQNAYHTHEYIRREWSRFFEVLDIRDRGIQNYQDAVLLRIRS